jgi:hypothetical protein
MSLRNCRKEANLLYLPVLLLYFHSSFGVSSEHRDYAGGTTGDFVFFSLKTCQEE